jgi:hypothetical protein
MPHAQDGAAQRAYRAPDRSSPTTAWPAAKTAEHPRRQLPAGGRRTSHAGPPTFAPRARSRRVRGRRAAFATPREPRGAIARACFGGKATARENSYSALLPRVLARARVRAAANGGLRSRVRSAGQRPGCGSGQAWLLRPLGSRALGTGPVGTSLARSSIRSPHLSPIVMSRSGRLRAFCENETWIDRGTTSLRRCSDRGTTSCVAVAARRSCGPWAIGTSFGTLRTAVARRRSFRGPDVRQKVGELQAFPAMARPGLEPGTPRFSAVARWFFRRPVGG